MKVLLFTLSLFSVSAFAQIEYSETTMQFQQSVTVRDLKCSTRAGSSNNRTFTEAPSIGIFNAAIELKHGAAVAKGCDMSALDAIADRSVQYFGYVQATITVIKKLEVDARVVSGQCVRNFTEQLLVDLGENVVLKTDEIFILKKATDCH